MSLYTKPLVSVSGQCVAYMWIMAVVHVPPGISTLPIYRCPTALPQGTRRPRSSLLTVVRCLVTAYRSNWSPNSSTPPPRSLVTAAAASLPSSVSDSSSSPPVQSQRSPRRPCSHAAAAVRPHGLSIVATRSAASPAEPPVGLGCKIRLFCRIPLRPASLVTGTRAARTAGSAAPAAVASHKATLIPASAVIGVEAASALL